MAVQFFINGAAFASFVPRLPEIRSDLDLNLDELGLALSIATGVGLVGGAAAPTLVARFGTRRLLTGFAALLVAGLALMSLVTDPVLFVIALAVMAVSDGVVDVAMNLQGSWLSARRHAPVMNRLHGLWSLGTVVGGLAAVQAASADVSVRTHLLVVAGVLTAGVVFVAGGLVAEDAVVDPTPVRPDGRPTILGGHEPLQPTPVGPERPAPSRRWLFALAGAFAVTLELAAMDWAAFRLTEDLGTTTAFAGLGYVAFTAGMTSGRFVGDSLLIRIDQDLLFRIALVITSVGMAGAALLNDRWMVLAAYGTAGLGGSTLFPKLYDDAAKHRGRAAEGIAWLRTGSGATAFAIPLVVGTLAASRLSVGAAVAIVSLPCAAGLMLLSLRSPSGSVGGSDSTGGD